MTRDELLASYATGNRYFCDADLYGANLRDANLYGAHLRGADLRGADLYGANLRDADLYGANLRGANLDGADLYGANLRDADLYGANLRGANLDGADLGDQWIVQGPVRSDGYQFMLTNFTDEGVRVKAGCRNLTIANAVRHWQATRNGTPLGNETYAIINQIVELAWLRGLIDDNMEAVKK